MIVITSPWMLGTIMKNFSRENRSRNVPYISARLASAATLMIVRAYIAVNVEVIIQTVRYR